MDAANRANQANRADAGAVGAAGAGGAGSGVGGGVDAKVIDIATKTLVTIGMDETLGWARQLFEHHKFHHILVVDGGRLVGVLSDRDLLKHLSPFIGAMDERKRDTDSLQKKAHQVMTRALVTASVGMTACQACELLLKAGVTCLPVVDDRMSPVGIVTWRDLLRWSAGVAGCAVPAKRAA